MGLFTGIGDFFRGAFGEDEEEKKRRKQREAEAARLRAAQQKPQTQPQNNQNQQVKVQNVNQLFGNKPLKVDVARPVVPESKPVAPAPRVKPAPLPDQEFKDIRTVKQEDKKLLGINMRPLLGDTYGKVDKVKVDQTFKTNKDKFVAGFDTLDEERKAIYLKEIRKQAEQGDQAAINSLKALVDSDRGKVHKDFFQRGADIASVPGRSVMRVATGVGQGASGLVDLATPGKGTNRVSKFLDEVAKNQDESAEDAGVGTAYKVLNVPMEVASYLLPGTLAVKVAGKLPKGAKLTENIVNYIAKNIDNAGDAGKVRSFLADRMRKGWTLDQAIEESLISAKYIGENASKGNDTSPASLATDVAMGVGGSLLFPARAARRLMGDGDLADEAAGGGITATAQAVEDRLTRAATDVPNATQLDPDATYDAVREKGVRNATEQELQTIANDVDRPSFDRKASADELKRRADEAEAAAKQPDLSETPSFQQKKDIENIIKRETDNLNRYLDEHPDLSLQQIEAAQKAAQDRATKLITELQESRRAALYAVEGQGDELAANASKQAETNAQVQADAAARTSPSPQQVVEGTSPSTSPEVQANDAYRPSTEEVLYGNTTANNPTPGRLSIPQLLSPDRIIRENVTRPLANAVDTAINSAQTSRNPLARGLGRFFTGFSREAGVAPELQTAKMHLRGGVEQGKLYRETVADLSKGMDESQTDRVWATLDPEHAQRRGMNPDEIVLSEPEKVLQEKLKTIIDNTTAENLRRGLITPEQAAQGSYIKRSYSVYDGQPEVDRFERGFRTELLNQFKGRKEVSDEMIELAITDPTYLVGKKTAESNAIWAMQDYGNYLAKNGQVVDQARPGYVQLPETPVFGDAAGKYVPRNVAEDFSGFQYNNAMVTAFNDLITAYDRLGLRQAKKQILTIFNPAVRLGNQTTNRVIFSQVNGINPLQFNIEMARAKQMIKNNDPIYREAVAQGLTGIDISQADFFANRISQSANGDKNFFKKALDYAKTSYSGADDQARVAAYSIRRKQGYSPEEAARLTQRGFQDYKSVGFFYDMAAKTPFIGNAFVRFAADSVRIAKNTAIDHPLRAAGTVAMWSAFTNGMSVISGESELKGDNAVEQAKNLVTGESKSEAQKEREARFGSPHLPFTDISSTVQTPWGEVNAARFMPWYSLNDIGDSAVSKFLPIGTSPVKLGEDGMPKIDAAGFQDPLLGQFVQLGMDRDFRNKSIQDPEMNPDRPDQLRNDPLSSEDKRNNVLRWLFTGNAPLGKETDAIYSAATGQEDLYGKERSLTQALFRAGGLKIEQQGEKQRDKRQGMEEYQKELEQIDRDIEELKMSEEAKEAYKRLTGYYKMRDEVDNEFSPGDKRKVKAEVYNFGEDKWKEYAAHPELYDLMVRKKQRENASDGKPIQPEFDQRLSEAFRRQLVQNKMVAPGDDAELDQRMYSSPEYDYYQELKKRYKDEAKKYYPERGDEIIDDETVRHQDAEFPTKPDLLKTYGAQYAQYLDGKIAKPEFTDAHKAAKEQYNKMTLDWTNKERAARGLPAITWDMWNNPTFGYDESPSGLGFGFGGGGSAGKAEPYGNNMGELTNFSRSVERLNPIEIAAMPQLAQLFARLQADRGGSRQKPKLGASASGR